MSLTNLFLIGLIFLSLAVIVLIFSKNINKLGELGKDISDGGKKKLSSGKKKSIQLLDRIKNSIPVPGRKKEDSQAKDLLSENGDRNGQGEFLGGVNGDGQGGKEFICSSEESYPSNLPGDKENLEEFINAKQNVTVIDDLNGEQTEIEREEELVEPGVEEEKRGFWSKFIRKSSRRRRESKNLRGDILLSGEENKNNFSEAIVSVREKKTVETQEEDNLIQDVVTVDRRLTFEDDVDLGIDYRILEKKILQRVETNPKDVENFRQLGELYIKMGELRDADGVYKFILKSVPRDSDAKRKLEKIKLLRRIKSKNR